MLWTLAGAIALVVAAFGLLQTHQAKQWLADMAADAASEPGVAELRIGAIEGVLPFEMTARDITVADAEGVWLRVDRARIVPSFRQTLATRPTVELIEAGTVALDRLPTGDAGDDAPPALGDMLVPLRVLALRIGRVEVGEPVFGTATAGRVNGRADLLPARGRANVTFDVELLDAAAGGTLSVNATVHGNALRARIEVQEPNATLLSGLARIGLPGYRATVEGDGPLDRWTGRMAADLEPGDDTAGWLTDLMGGPASIRSEIALRAAEGLMVHLSNLEADSAFGPFTGGADLDLIAGTMQTHFRFENADLAGAQALLGVPAEGQATITATADGPFDAPSVEAQVDAGAVSVAGMSVDGLSGTVSMPRIVPLPEGSVDLAVEAGFLDATVTGNFALLADDAVRLSGLTVRDGRGGRVTADLTIALDGPLAAGRLAVDIANLAPWSNLAGRPLRGSVRSEVDLTHEAGRQSAAFDLSASALAIGDGGADATVGSLQATGSLGDVLARPSGRAEVTAEDLTAGGLSADTARIVMRGDAGELDFEMAAAGGERPDYEIDGSGTLRADLPAWTLRLDRFAGRVGDYQLALRSPATATADGDAIALDGLALSLDDGSLDLAGRLAPNALTTQITARDIPAAIAELVGPQTGVTGRIDVDLSLDARAGRAPTGDMRVAARDIVVPGLDAGDKAALQLDASGGIDGQGLSLSGTVASAIAPPLGFEVSLAALPGGARGLPQVGADSELNARAEGALDLSQALILVPVAEIVLRGELEVSAQATGTLSEPRLSGGAELANGYFESLTTGAVLRDIALTASLDGGMVRVEEMTASDGEGGTLTGQGALSLFEDTLGDGLEVSVDVERFRAMRLDIATIQLSGEIALRSTGDRLELAGALTVDRGNVNIPRSMPQDSVVSAALDTSRITISTPAGRAQGLGGAEGETAELPVDLAISIDVPGQLFVRGRGLESEWGGGLQVSGTVSDPRLNGRLEVRRGSLAALGRTFDVTAGTVTFVGPIDRPEIAFTAESEAEAVTALVRAEGTPNDLSIELGSRPELPQDEILSRLFFGKSAGQISAAQALQLAEAAAALSGTFAGTGGVTGRLRDTLGIDVLTFEDAEGGDARGTKLRAGKYLAEDVFLRIDQGLTPESSSVGVEYEIFENITIEGDVSKAGSDPGAGINFKLDY